MKYEAPSPVYLPAPFAAGIQRPIIRKNKIPLYAKVSGAVFLAVFVPVYLRT